jgi:hypothetical protein
MNYTLKHQRDLVALEAFSVPDLSGLVRKVFPTIEGSLKGFRNFFTSQPAVGMTSKQSEFVKTIEKQRYTNIMSLTAYVPEGLKVTYLEYARALFPAADHAAGSVKLLDDYALFLSLLVSDKLAIHDTTSRNKVFVELATKREQLLKDMGACFEKGSTRTDRKIEDVVQRNADWPEVFKHVGDISTVMNKIERKHLNKKIEECTELLERIGQKIERGEFDKVSPEVILDLSDGAYQVASELEFYAAMYYRTQALATAVDRTVAHVKKVTSANPSVNNADPVPV